MTIPASQRYVKFDPVVLTDTFNVPFPIFANDDLRVVVDGVETPLFSVLAVYYRGRCETAKIVLTAEVFGVSVEIYGKRSPRRSNDFAANSPDLARNLQNDSDILTAVQQEQERDRARSLKVPASFAGSLEIPAPIPGTALMGAPNGLSYVNGPEIANLAGAASAAAASAAAAAASAAEALAKENSMIRDRGPLVTGATYAPSDTFNDQGNVYITQVVHVSTNLAADLGAGRIRLWVEKGATGSGVGNMLNEDNLSGLSNKPLARANLGLGALATLNLLPFSGFDPVAIISDVEGLALNKVPNAFPVAKAVTDYVDSSVVPALPASTFSWTSNVAQIVFNNLGGLDAFVIDGNIAFTGALSFELSSDNGVTWLANGSYDSYHQDAAIITSNTNSPLISRSSATLGMILRFERFSSGKQTLIEGRGKSTYLTYFSTMCRVPLNQAFNAVRFLATNITAGQLEVFGVRRGFVTPVLISASPSDNSINVSMTVSPSLIFSEIVVPGAGFITLRRNIGGIWSDVEQIDVVADQGIGGGQVIFSGATVTINPTAFLFPGREYALQVSPTAIRDLSNNFFAGIVDDLTVSFVVATGTPSAYALAQWALTDNPSPGANSVSINIVELVFDGGSPITALQYTLNAGVSWLPLTGVGTGTRSITVPAATLASINVRAVNSVGNGAISDTKTVTPTSMNIAPVLSGVSISTPSIVNYDASEASSLFWKVDDFATQTGAQIEAGGGYASGSFATAAGINDNVVAFTGTPVGLRYLHVVLKDSLGLYSAVHNEPFTFAGGDTVAPTIIATSPVDNGTGIAIATSPTITFIENVVFDVGLITIRENNGGWSDWETFNVATEQGSGNGQVAIAGSVLTINPTASFVNNREYAIRIAAGAIKDVAGNPFAGITNDTTISFTTVASGATQRNPYSGFTDPSHVLPNAGWSVSGGKMNATAVPSGNLFEFNWGFLAAVTPSIPYDIQITCDSMTSSPKDFVFYADYWRGQNVGDGLSTIRAGDASSTRSLGVGLSAVYTVTPPADCTHVKLFLQYAGAGTLTAVFDNFTITG